MKIHCRWWSFEKVNHHGVTTSLTVSTGGPADRICTGVRPYHDTASLIEIQENRRNRPRRKFLKDDGALQTRRILLPIDRTIEKGERIHVSKGADDCWCHDGVKRDHPSGTDGDVQRGNHRVEKSNHWPEYMGAHKDFLSLRPSRVEETSNNCRKRGIHRGGTKHLWCTALTSRRESRGDRPH